VFDDVIDPTGMVVNDFAKAAIGLWSLIGFKKKLGGMADGAKRVADLVGDARRQSSKGGELQLLSFLGKQAVVFDEEQCVRLRMRCKRSDAHADIRSVGPGFQAR